MKDSCGISAEDVAKRLIDYGFHAPTLSFPVAGTLMVEPTESEPLVELDRFCDAMVAIRREIAKVEAGEWPRADNPLVNAPHTAEALLKADWPHAYSREQAAYPVPALKRRKYWSPVGRVDNVPRRPQPVLQLRADQRIRRPAGGGGRRHCDAEGHRARRGGVTARHVTTDSQRQQLLPCQNC